MKLKYVGAGLVFGLAGLLCGGAAHAEVTIWVPSFAQQLEPGQTVMVQYSFDNNSADDQYNDITEVYLATSPDAPRELIATFPRDASCEPLPPGTNRRDCQAELTVPNVTCGDCRIQFVQVPGRGDYNSQGITAISIGKPYTFGEGTEVTPVNGEAPFVDESEPAPVPDLSEPIAQLPPQGASPKNNPASFREGTGSDSGSGVNSDSSARCSMTPGSGVGGHSSILGAFLAVAGLVAARRMGTSSRRDAAVPPGP